MTWPSQSNANQFVMYTREHEPDTPNPKYPFVPDKRILPEILPPVNRDAVLLSEPHVIVPTTRNNIKERSVR